MKQQPKHNQKTLEQARDKGWNNNNQSITTQRMMQREQRKKIKES